MAAANPILTPDRGKAHSVALGVLCALAVVQVSAMVSGQLNGVERDAMMLFDTRRGVVGSLQTGWRSGSGPDFSLSIIGERGTLVASAAGLVLTGLDAVPQALAVPDGGPTVQRAFVEAVEAGRATAPDGYDGRAAVAVVQAAYESARLGRTVDVAG